jgi:hypothetical protein
MIDRVLKGKDGLLTEFLPTPQELIDTVSGFVSEDKQAAHDLQQEANRKKYGHPDWYQWNIANWGTKWDFGLENVEQPDPNTVTAAFDSAWAPPTRAYEQLMELGFEITAYYYEPGMAFVGKWEDGCDDYYEYGGETSETVREAIGEELDDYFGISESMADWEAENAEDLE